LHYSGVSVEENCHLAHPAGAARRTTILAERRGARKGAPPGAAQRTLAGEHRSAIPTTPTGGSAGERLHPAGGF